MDMNKINAAKRAQIVASLVEGNSINATVHMTGAAKHTVLKLLADLEKAVQPIRIRCSGTCPASAFNVLKYGHSGTPKKRMFPMS